VGPRFQREEGSGCLSLPWQSLTSQLTICSLCSLPVLIRRQLILDVDTAYLLYRS
jgi:hypothetical protein